MKHALAILVAAVAVAMPALAAGAKAKPADANAQPVDTKVFGFELGQPLSLPECPFEQMTGYKRYEPQPAKTCFQEAIPKAGYGQPMRTIVFSQQEAPSMVKFYHMLALEIDGKLMGVQFYTYGLPVQDGVFDSLTAKYGAATTKTLQSVEARFGVAKPAVIANWKLKGLDVNFWSHVGKVDLGEVTVDLPEATALKQKWADSENAQKRAL